jgi:hypothetical protein
MEVTDQLHAPADLPSVKDSPVTFGWGAGQVWTLWNTEKSQAHNRNRTLAIKPIACP